MIYKTNNQQRPTVQHGELHSIFYDIYMGKEPEEEWKYVQLNYFVVHLKLTQHCKSTIFQYKTKQQKEDSTKFSQG